MTSGGGGLNPGAGSDEEDHPAHRRRRASPCLPARRRVIAHLTQGSIGEARRPHRIARPPRGPNAELPDRTSLRIGRAVALANDVGVATAMRDLRASAELHFRRLLRTKSRSGYTAHRAASNRGRFGPMHLSGHYSNHSPAFTGVLDAFPGGSPDQGGHDRLVPDAPKTRRAGNGVIQRAVTRALLEADCPMDVGDTHTAVEERLGHPVSRDSVNSCLSTGARGPAPRFERVGRGLYRLMGS